MSFWDELRRRHVVRNAIGYTAVSWLTLQIADILLNNLAAPDWVFPVLLLSLAAGLVATVILSWVFQWTPRGLKRQLELDQPEPRLIDATQQGASGAESKEFDSTGRGTSPPLRNKRRYDGSPSIVVLPFVNRSDDPSNEYFSDGLTEEIIADLTGIKALSVISRTSSMLLKGTNKDLCTIGQDLDVRYVLEGSVRKAGPNLRITAQLVDAANDGQLWSEKFRGTVDDIFEVQERVSREIVRALDITLTADESQKLAEHPIADARAFELYLRARTDLRQLVGDAVDRVPEYLAEAMEIEGDTPPLLALKAWSLVSSVKAGISRDHKPLDDAMNIALQLIAQSPELPYGFAILGFISYERGQLQDASKYLSRAIIASPNDTDALFYLAATYFASGHGEGAADTARRMVACDPLSPIAWMISGAVPWFLNGRFEEGLSDLQHALALDPNSYFIHWHIGYAYAAVGQLDKAATHAAFLASVGPDMPYTEQLLALVDALENRPQQAIDRISAVDVAPLDGHTTFHLAEPLMVAGAKEQALDLLEGVVESGFYPYRFFAEYCPFMGSLRSEQRFETILARSKQQTEAFMTAELAGI
jgi:TolB-like protein/tetratricopeptide (TPR) repeat protein